MESAEVLVDITADVADGTELEARVKVRQLEVLEVFNSLRLSIVLLAAEILTELVAELKVWVKIRQLKARVEIRQLEARVEIRQPEELEVLLVAVRY